MIITAVDVCVPLWMSGNVLMCIKHILTLSGTGYRPGALVYGN